MTEPRVLVLSVPSWSERLGTDTYISLFEGYNSDCLASLYIREEMPDNTVCRRHFRISESMVLRSLWRRGIATGKALDGYTPVADSCDIAASAETERRYERHRRRRPWLLLYAREVLWFLGRWRSRELDEFVDDFRPDVVLFGMEGYIHFNRIARYVITRTGARGVGYFYDDNFTYRQRPWSLGHRVYRCFQRHDLRKTVRYCSAFFAISPKTKSECDEVFGIDSILLTKPVGSSAGVVDRLVREGPVRMLYTGNLLIGRLQTLEAIGRALTEVNADGLRAVLDVYTNTAVTQKECRRLGPAIVLRSGVSRNQVGSLQEAADVLVFMEALKGRDKLTARLSFSTKITDYLQAGRCILAVGDKQVGPIEYLRAEDAALCATDQSEIAGQVRRLVESQALVDEYARKAASCGRRNHDERLVRKRLRDTLAMVATGRLDFRDGAL